MIARTGLGNALPRGTAPEAPPAAAPCHGTQTTVPMAGAPPARTGIMKTPPRQSPFRDTPTAAAVPMAQQLASAAQVCQATLANTVAIFDGAAKGNPVPISVAEETVDQLLACLDADAEVLLGLIRLKAHGDYACMHSVAVCALMASLARQMGFGPMQRREAALAGLLHDIGKAFIPAPILAKPGRLSDDEFTVVRGHPQRGFHALEAAGGIAETVMDVAQSTELKRAHPLYARLG